MIKILPFIVIFFLFLGIFGFIDFLIRVILKSRKKKKDIKEQENRKILESEKSYQRALEKIEEEEREEEERMILLYGSDEEKNVILEKKESVNLIKIDSLTLDKSGSISSPPIVKGISPSTYGYIGSESSNSDLHERMSLIEKKLYSRDTSDKGY